MTYSLSCRSLLRVCRSLLRVCRSPLRACRSLLRAYTHLPNCTCRVDDLRTIKHARGLGAKKQTYTPALTGDENSFSKAQGHVFSERRRSGCGKDGLCFVLAPVNNDVRRSGCGKDSGCGYVGVVAVVKMASGSFWPL